MFGFGRRVKNSFAGMIFGFFMVPAAIGIHGWNEYRTVHRSRGLAEAANSVVSIPDEERLAPELSDKLVHLSGVADTQEILEDPDFPIRERAIHYARRVEMYQWVEEKKTRGRDESQSEPSYEYKRGWRPGRIDSREFHDVAGHENPELEYQPLERSAEEVRIGIYRLNNTLKESIDAWQAIEVPEQAILETIARENPQQFLFRSNEVFWSRDAPEPDHPRVGDLRIQFEKVVPCQVSLIGKLRDNAFEPYETSNGEKVQRLYLGKLSAKEVIERLMTENTIIAWGLRFLGLALCIAGFSLTLGPLRALVSFVPIVGELTGWLLFLVSCLLALIVSLITIGVSWIAVRPLLGATLLGLSAAAAYLIYVIRKRQEPPVIDASMIVE